jgi:steroid 5-alpha reductase family enzyme
MQIPALLAASFAFVVVYMLAIWAASLVKRDASIVDIGWGPGFAAIAWITGSLAGGGPRASLVTALATLWGLRLGLHLLVRAWGAPEDPRYQAMRRHYGDRFPLMSLVVVYALQGAVMWLVSLPIVFAQQPGGAPLGALDGLAALVFGVGFLFESVGDWQLARFRRDPGNRGRVLEQGLWRYTRHPNYFGDCLVHWGLFGIALGAPGGWMSVAGPVIMTFMLLRVSGVVMLERTIARRRPGYAGYRERTSGFLPWRSRSGGGGRHAER